MIPPASAGIPIKLKIYSNTFMCSGVIVAMYITIADITMVRMNTSWSVLTIGLISSFVIGLS